MTLTRPAPGLHRIVCDGCGLRTRPDRNVLLASHQALARGWVVRAADKGQPATHWCRSCHATGAAGPCPPSMHCPTCRIALGLLGRRA